MTTARDLARFGQAFTEPGYFTADELAQFMAPIALPYVHEPRMDRLRQPFSATTIDGTLGPYRSKSLLSPLGRSGSKSFTWPYPTSESASMTAVTADVTAMSWGSDSLPDATSINRL